MKILEIKIDFNLLMVSILSIYLKSLGRCQLQNLLRYITIFFPTGEMAEKAFLRLRDKYARAKKATKEKNKS